MARVSPKHALDEQELRFCTVYLAFGERDGAEAYRRAYFASYRDANGVRVVPAPPPAPVVAQLSKRLLKQAHIQNYLTESKRTTGEHARQVLAEQVLLGDDKDARLAAERVLDLEDKLGFRDAVEEHARILCEVGAEVEVALPVRCHACGVQLKATVPMRDMFPALAAAEG